MSLSSWGLSFPCCCLWCCWTTATLGLRKSAGCGVLHSACFAVHKTLPHPFFPLNLSAAKQKRLKSQGPQAEAQGPHFPRVSQSQQWRIWVPNSKFTALSQKPPSFQVKHLLSSQRSREDTFLPCFSGDMSSFYFLHIFSSLYGTTPSLHLMVLISVSPQLGQSLPPHGVSWIGDLLMETERWQTCHYPLKRESSLVSAVEIPQNSWCCPSWGWGFIFCSNHLDGTYLTDSSPLMPLVNCTGEGKSLHFKS